MSHNSAPGSERVFLSAFIVNLPHSSLRRLSQDKDARLIDDLLRVRSDNDATLGKTCPIAPDSPAEQRLTTARQIRICFFLQDYAAC